MSRRVRRKQSLSWRINETAYGKAFKNAAVISSDNDSDKTASSGVRTCIHWEKCRVCEGFFCGSRKKYAAFLA
jgi:hypothetical protein